MSTDPISDLLTRIRNAVARSREEVIAPASRVKIDILKVLKSEGYITNFKEVNENTRKNLLITLKYDESGLSAISNLKRVSKPGLRVYSEYKTMPRVLNGIGLMIVSTSQGIMSGKDARKQKLGGELLCTIY